MAKSYGGKYSPRGTGTGPTDPAHQEAVEARAVDRATRGTKLLYVPAIVLVFTSLGSGPATLVTALIAACILTLAAWLTQEGLKAETAYKARKVARKPAVPRKMLGSLATSVGIGMAAYTGDTGMVGAILYGVAALGLHVAAFGIDPMTDKRMEGIDTFQQDRVARVVEQADETLSTMRSHITRLEDRDLTGRVDAFQATARKMARTVQEDPRDLTSARKYLGVYLEGARDATVKFVDLYLRKPDPDARTHYIDLLNDLQTNFAARTDKMLVDDRTDMDIEIKVLRDRLQREGL